MSNTEYTIVKGARDCPWCDKAGALLEAKGLSYRVRKISKADLEELGSKYNHTTVPMVFHGVKFVGGYDSLEEYLDTPPVS